MPGSYLGHSPPTDALIGSMVASQINLQAPSQRRVPSFVALFVMAHMGRCGRAIRKIAEIPRKTHELRQFVACGAVGPAHRCQNGIGDPSGANRPGAANRSE